MIKMPHARPVMKLSVMPATHTAMREWLIKEVYTNVALLTGTWSKSPLGHSSFTVRVRVRVRVKVKVRVRVRIR